MFIEKVGENHHIYPEGKETLPVILFAIGLASASLARPAGLGWLQYESMLDYVKLIDGLPEWLRRSPDKNWELDLDYVQGRQVKTFIRQEGDHLVFRTPLFERDRGSPDRMLAAATWLLVYMTRGL